VLVDAPQRVPDGARAPVGDRRADALDLSLQGRVDDNRGGGWRAARCLRLIGHAQTRLPRLGGNASILSFAEQAMHESEKTLGIIGGAGVGAAAALYVEVAARYRAVAAALPQIVIWNLPLSDELERSFLGAGADPAAVAAAAALVAQGAQRLVDAGASVVAMPCNSLQRVAARESERVGLPFIDMIAATVDAAAGLGHREAVLLATSTTYAFGHYDGYGIDMIEPPAAERSALASLIARLAQGPPPSAAELLELIDRVRRPHAAVVLGCTDICGLVAPADAPGVVESLGCLADACVQALLAPTPAASAV